MWGVLIAVFLFIIVLGVGSLWLVEVAQKVDALAQKVDSFPSAAGINTKFVELASEDRNLANAISYLQTGHKTQQDEIDALKSRITR